MYITVIDYSTQSVTCLAWDVTAEDATNENTEDILQQCGYHLSEISYMVTEDKPDYGVVEVNDILEDL